jgi:hypothetical protein
VGKIVGTPGQRNEVAVSAESEGASWGAVASVFLSDENAAARWNLRCWVRTRAGRFAIGMLRTTAPQDSTSGKVRLVALLYVPGAVEYIVEAEQVEDDSVQPGQVATLSLTTDPRCAWAHRPLTVALGHAQIAAPTAITPDPDVEAIAALPET